MKCNLLEYYDRFIAEGFDQLQSLLDVTEADLIAMDVKRGHRRRLQREIVTTKGVPPNIPLPLYIQQGSGLEDSSEHTIGNVIHPPPLNHNIPPKILYINGPPNSNVSAMGSTQSSTRDLPDPPDPPDNVSTKRKYKRHPKRDKNAPIKPLSAYVMFAHKVREEFSGQNISFPDMAKIVGDRWKNIRPEEKESYEIEAAKKKEEYQAEMSVYKKTEYWKKYQEYLKEFKEKHELNSRDPNKRKRIKMEPSPDSDNTRSGYSSTRSTSVGYDNGSSGNTSSGSSNGNGNGNGNGSSNSDGGNNTPTKSYSDHGYPNYLPPYPHYNPNVYGFTSNNSGQKISSSILTPPPSIINTSNPTTLDDLYANDANDSNAGDDQSQLENGSRSGNGSSSSRSTERQSFEDSSDSTSSSNTPLAVSMETDDNPDHQQSQQNQSQNQQDNVQQDDAKNTK